MFKEFFWWIIISFLFVLEIFSQYSQNVTRKNISNKILHCLIIFSSLLLMSLKNCKKTKKNPTINKKIKNADIDVLDLLVLHSSGRSRHFIIFDAGANVSIADL